MTGNSGSKFGAAEAVKWVGTWVQTDRAGHEAFTHLVMKKPRAAAVMHMLISRMGENNAVVISQKNLARLCGVHVNTVIKALGELKADRWIETVQIGGTGTINAYVINARIAWYGSRDKICHSQFSASVFVSSDDQPDISTEEKPPLRKFPRVSPGERQIPTGPGEPPPSSPPLPGMEVDLPTLTETADRGGDARPIGDLLSTFLPSADTEE